jgi:hypothetical protein
VFQTTNTAEPAKAVQIVYILPALICKSKTFFQFFLCNPSPEIIRASTGKEKMSYNIGLHVKIPILCSWFLFIRGTQTEEFDVGGEKREMGTSGNFLLFINFFGCVDDGVDAVA